MKKQDVTEKAQKMAAAKQALLSKGDASSPLVLHAGATPQDVGVPPRLNKTGAMATPLMTKAQVKDAEQLTSPSIATPDLHLYCAEEEKTFGLMGTMPPPPPTMKGMMKPVLAAAKGQKATVLLDKVAERLAFERTGTRLYDGLIAKLAAKGSYEGGPTAEELMRIRDEELAHFHMLVDIVRQIGGDPTALTPSANVAAVSSSGVGQVIADPRATVPEALSAIHVAELADNDGWTMLIRLCDELGEDKIAERMRIAEADEMEHLALVRRWLHAYTSLAANRERPMDEEGEAGVAATT